MQSHSSTNVRHKGIYQQFHTTTGMPSSFFSSSKHMVTTISIAINIVLLIVVAQYILHNPDHSLLSKSLVYHGGHPLDTHAGTCWCASDQYCICTPNLAIDLVIASGPDHLWIVRRKDTSQWAIMGGFVEIGETVEAAVRRELKEELGIELEGPPLLFGVYSDPRRDNRRHTVSVVFAITLPEDAKPQAADDIKEVIRIPLSDIEHHDFFADHKTIFMDYKRAMEKKRRNHENEKEGDGDFAVNIIRSTCFDHGIAVI